MIVYDSTLNQQVLIDKIDSKDLQHPILQNIINFILKVITRTCQ